MSYNESMIVLGIDPGLASTGWALVKKNEKPELIDYGCITTDKKENFAERLCEIFHEVKKLALKTKPQVMAIEDLFFAKNAKTAIDVAQAMGVIKVACRESKIPVFEYTPLNIKTTITGYGRADKKQMEEMVLKILDLKKKIRPHHAVDAIAVSLTHLFTNQGLS